MAQEILNLIKELVKEEKLTFTCTHQTNSKYALTNDPESFLDVVEDGLLFYSKYRPHVLTREYCFQCGQYLNYTLVETELVPVNEKEPCFTEKVLTLDIEVPTGELMIADWHKHGRDVLTTVDVKRELNSMKGTFEKIKDFAVGNIAYFYVGNTSPHIYQVRNELTIGRNSYNEQDEEIELVPGADDCGSVCTDLWWVTICDRAVYEQLAIEAFDEIEGKKRSDEAAAEADVVVIVEPGRYRLTYYAEVDEDNRLFATFEKIN